MLQHYSPDQNGHANIVGSASLKGDNFAMNLSALNGGFTGELAADKKMYQRDMESGRYDATNLA